MFPVNRYRVHDGKIKVITVLRENVVVGASIPTWLCIEGDGRRFRTSVGYGWATKHEAWEAHLQELEQSIVHNIGLIKEIQAINRKTRKEIQAVRTKAKKERVKCLIASSTTTAKSC